MPSLGLYELLAPQFLVGFAFPDHIDSYLSRLEVVDLQTAVAETAIVHSGRVQFGSGQSGTASHQAPGETGVLRFSDVGMQFRLTLPRDGTSAIDTALSRILALPALPVSLTGAVTGLKGLFDALGPTDATAAAATDYPGLGFRLELLVSVLTFHLPAKDWLPGEYHAATSRIVPKPIGAGEAPDVRFVLPRIALVYSQGEDFSNPPVFAVTSWGDSGFDAASDLAEGEILRMEPPIALNASQTFAFGVDQLGVDNSANNTPAELLGRFGIDEGWKGIHCKAVQLYFSQENKGWAFNLGVRDLLVSFSGDVWLQARADLIGPADTLVVEPSFFAGGKVVTSSTPATAADGLVTLPPDGLVQVAIRGGKPPFDVAIAIADSNGVSANLNGGAVVAALDQGGARAAGDYVLTITVTDASPTTKTLKYRLTIAARADDSARGLAADRQTPPAALPAAVLTQLAGPANMPASYGISLENATHASPVLVINGPAGATLRLDGQPVPLAGNKASIPVPAGTTSSPLAINVVFPAQTSTEQRSFTLFFSKGQPDPEHTDQKFANYDLPRYTGSGLPRDTEFDNSRPPGQSGGAGGAAALRQWLQSKIIPTEGIELAATASFEDSANSNRDQKLSERRLAVVKAIAAAAGIRPPAGAASGHFKPGTSTVNDPPDDPNDRNVVVTGKASVARTPAITLNATISRPAVPTAPPPPAPPKAPIPKPPSNAPPSVFRRAHLRFGLERSQLTLLEIGGQFDFETGLEAKLRNSTSGSGVAIGGSELGLRLQSQDPRTPDGVVDFRLTITYDPATFSITEELAAGAAPAGKKGLAFREYPAGNGGTLVNSAGALLAMAPVINSVAASVDPKSAGDWVTIGASVAVPLTLGISGILKTSALTFYGMAIKSRQFVPPGEPLRVANVGVIFDYGVDLLLNIPPLGITSRGPIRVRYNAVGMRINFGAAPVYEPIFDTSKGYSLEIADPNLITLPPPLDNILRILAVRLARVNPLTLELDLALKVDLGVVSVDTFKVKWPIDPQGAPQILPSGARLNVPGVMIGEGIVNILQPPTNPPPDMPTGGGFEGMVDVTLVPLKLRIAASIGVRDIQQQTPPRRAVAVFLGLSVTFPAPIVLGQSGLGLYGLSGLFAMHYRRIEDDPNPNDAIGPALHWLANVAEGEPSKLRRADGTLIWDVALDRWSFGVGAILGTVEGGFLVLTKGTLVLELPGPRILIFVNVKIITPPIKALKPAAELVTGILGVLDLDFNLGRVTVGILIDMKLGPTGDLLSISIPIELFFNLRDTRDWHFYIGTFQAKVTARILNLFNAYGYLMVSGGDIADWPGRGTTRTLPGLAVATGFGASIELGSRSMGLYATAELLVDAAVSFKPFFFVGTGEITGELCVFIVTIEVSGRADVEGPDPVWARLELCGSVKILGLPTPRRCVKLNFGSQRPALVAPDLVSGVFLQSHAPVLTAGQATERPIDASLGNAVAVGNNLPLPVVPIDTVLVVQMIGPPSVAGATSFTDAIATPPNLLAVGIPIGGDATVRYELEALTLDQPLVGSGVVPATWRLDPGSTTGGSKTGIDLALLSRVPVTGERALERSTDLTGLVALRWQNLCTPPAPPTCVLWTFCGQPIGTPERGWILAGHPLPDPPGTLRASPPPVWLDVRLPAVSTADWQRSLLAPLYGWSLLPAMVIAGDCRPRRPPDRPRGDPGGTLKCWLELLDRVRRWLCQLLAKLCARIDPRRSKLQRDPEPGPPKTPEPPQMPDLQEVPVQPPMVKQQDMLGAGRFGFVDQTPGPADDAKAEDVCCRALRLPRGQTVAPPTKLSREDDATVRDIEAAVAANAYVEIVIERSARVRLLFGLTVSMRRSDAISVEEWTRDGVLVRQSTLNSLGATDIAANSSNLPADWRSGNAIWIGHVNTAMALLRDPALATPVATLADFVPRPDTSRLRLRIVPGNALLPADQALLALLQTCPIAEIERHQRQTDIRQGEINTLARFSDVNAPAKLLRPNTRYRLGIRYRAIVVAADGTEGPPVFHTPAFEFQTDAAPPRRLDPYVMGTTPDDGEAKVFTSDPVKLVFNDAAVKALYEAYGKSLKIVLRSADGAPIPATTITQLDPTDAAFATPYREALDAMAAGLPCLAGQLTRRLHATATGAFTLLPEMAYSLDVELDPPNPPGPPEKPSTPLFRRQFTTGRFADMAALAADLTGRRVRHHRLLTPLGGLPALVAQRALATDVDIENSFVAAGMDRLPAAVTAAIHILWVPGAAGRHTPHALMIDAPEPLWRTRAAHRTEAVPQPSTNAAASDPAFRRLVTAREDSLILQEKSPVGRVAGYVRSPAGTRTIILLNASAAGSKVELELHRPASTLFRIAEATVPLFSVTLDTMAPWEMVA